MSRKERGVIHQHLRRVLVEKVSERVRETALSRSAAVPPALHAEFVVATFMLVLDWWVESSVLSAREADDVFRRMVLPTLEAVAGG